MAGGAAGGAGPDLGAVLAHDPAAAREFAATVEKLNLPPVVPIVVIGKIAKPEWLAFA